MKSISRWIAIAVVPVLLGGSSAAAEVRSRPNVIIIMVDTLRADHLGCYGHGGGISPAIDRFSKESVVFDRCAAAASWTMPSVVSFLTGLYPERHQVIHAALSDDGKDPRHVEILSPKFLTMPEIFARSGYRTVGLVANPWLKPDSGLARGYGEYQYIERTAMIESVTAWVKREGVAVSTSPLFLYIHILDVHGHYQFAEEDFQAMKKAIGERDERPLSEAEKKQINWYMRATFADKPERLDSLMSWRAAYAAGVKRFDRRIAPLFDALRITGLMDSSIVILTSDHGEGLLQHGWLEHGKTLHIEEVHVPLIVRMPKGKLGGRRVAPWVSLVDALPTLADLCKLDMAGTRPQGVSLAPTLNGGRLLERTVYSSTFMLGFPQTSAIYGSTHLLSYEPQDRRLELFNLAMDPGEMNDLSPVRQSEAQLLRIDLDAHILGAASGQENKAETTPMSEEMKEQLRSLGYLQ